MVSGKNLSTWASLGYVLELPVISQADCVPKLALM